MKLNAMVRQVYEFAGVRTDDPLAVKQMVVDALNNAQQYLATQYDWPWMQGSTTFDTVIGQVEYVPPTDWSATRRIVSPKGDDLPRVPAGQAEDDWRDLVDLPQEYAIDDDLIKLYPKPSSVDTYVHEYTRTIADLDGDDDESIFPTQYHNVIIEFALARVLEVQGSNAAQAAAARASQMMVNMRRAVRRTRGPQRIRIREGAYI